MNGNLPYVLIRSALILFIALMGGTISEKKIVLENELKKSRHDLEIWADDLEKMVEAKTRDLAVLFKVSKVASSSLDLDHILKKILDIFIVISDADRGYISVIDPMDSRPCWEIKACSSYQCPAFELVSQKCWNLPNTLCCSPAKKGGDGETTPCLKCNVFNEATIYVHSSKGFGKGDIKNQKGKVKDSLSGSVITKGKPAFSKEVPVEFQDGFSKQVVDKGNFLGIPIMTNENVAGAICLFGVQEKAYKREEIELISAAARQVAIAIRNAQLYNATKTLALTDDLTGLHNYRCFQEKLSEEMERAKRGNHSLTIGIIDIDGFKLYNDVLGHMAGNNILKEFAKILKEQVRLYDIVARYGGDEFCVIFPETEKTEAFEISERMRLVIANKKFPMEEIIPGGLTISTGIASYPDDSTSLEEIIIKADKALYDAKKTGRNTTKAV